MPTWPTSCKANAQWKGSLRQGEGNISTDSGALSNAPNSFGTRFENGQGTNPEELIGAAHAGCFSMVLAKPDVKADLDKGFLAEQRERLENR